MRAVLSASHYERLVTKHRFRLEAFARRLRRCSRESAEDLACEAILHASTRLAKYDPETGEEGWLSWMRDFVRFVASHDRRQECHSPATLGFEDPGNLADLPLGAQLSDRAWLDALPRHLQHTVWLYLDGYTQKEIADELCVHRNTIVHRLQQASVYAQRYLGEITFSLFHDLNNHTTYTAPPGMSRHWRTSHPGDIHIRFDEQGNVRGLSQRRGTS